MYTFYYRKISRRLGLISYWLVCCNITL